MKIFEIGVGELYTCRTRQHWGKEGFECHLFEPNPKIYNEIHSESQKFNNVKLYNLAISNKIGNAELFLMNNCSFVNGTASPISSQDSTRDNYHNTEKIIINTDIIDNYDDGKIDILLLDMEGSEWFVLEGLKSRPTQIIIETHIPHNSHPYLNKYLNQILFWMWDNNYSLFGKSETDSHFIKNV